MNRAVIIVLAFVFVLGACQAPMRGATVIKYKQFGVELKPKQKAGQWVLDVKSKSQGYKKAGKPNGYVGFDQGEEGPIFFGIQGEPLAAGCASEEPASWVITGIRLSTTGNSTTGKGSNFGNSQDSWLKVDFPDVILSDGVILDMAVAEASATVSIFNENAHNAAEGEKLIYYEVTATRCPSNSADPLVTATTDPMVRNKGK